MPDTPPKVSVLMSVYNGKNYLEQCISSILNQSFKDFEFIIINDGSTDRTEDILNDFAEKDPRIHIIHQQNTGLTRALNIGLSKAKGAYIARQDADDISSLDRLKKQVNAMENTNAVLCGSVCVNIHPNGTQVTWKHRSNDNIKKTISYFSPFAHSTVMMDTKIAKRLGGYNETYKTAQDTEFWMRFAKEGLITMLPDILVTRHTPETSISRQKQWRQIYDCLRARMTHNKRLHHKAISLYYAVRILILGALPAKIIQVLKARGNG